MSATDPAMFTLERLRRALAGWEPRRRWGPRRMRHSAVAIMLRNSEVGLQALMIKRAEFAGDPWSGHMAFPGGGQERHDYSSRLAAERETLEEVGIDLPRQGSPLGSLSDRRAGHRQRLRPITVTPWLYALDAAPPTRPNYEVAEVLWIPLAFIADPANREQMRWRTARLPCVWYRGRRIWGLSLGMLDELLSVLVAG